MIDMEAFSLIFFLLFGKYSLFFLVCFGWPLAYLLQE